MEIPLSSTTKENKRSYEIFKIKDITFERYVQLIAEDDRFLS